MNPTDLDLWTCEACWVIATYGDNSWMEIDSLSNLWLSGMWQTIEICAQRFPMGA